MKPLLAGCEIHLDRPMMYADFTVRIVHYKQAKDDRLHDFWMAPVAFTIKFFFEPRVDVIGCFACVRMGDALQFWGVVSEQRDERITIEVKECFLCKHWLKAVSEEEREGMFSWLLERSEKLSDDCCFELQIR